MGSTRKCSFFNGTIIKIHPFPHVQFDQNAIFGQVKLYLFVFTSVFVTKGSWVVLVGQNDYLSI
jgi:hypothetical protein